jgi:hypothetical protein
MDYSGMLLMMLDIYLKGLDDYIDIQDTISEVSRNMDEYPEDDRYFLQKILGRSGIRRAKEFLDVILFMHAVPQRAPDRWDVLDHESDVTWFREHCKIYQNKTELIVTLCIRIYKTHITRPCHTEYQHTTLTSRNQM